MLNLVVCVSGGGTNLQAILDAVSDGTVSNTRVCGVICNNQGAYALERAKNAGIEAVCISPKDFESRQAYYKAFLDQANAFHPGLIVLAGFLVTIPKQMVEQYPGKIMNIHPSLIPSFCGVGYYGLKVHEAVIERGVKITGATVHFVDEGTDTGPIILQKAVEVLDTDTPKQLQQRVMEQAEWVILPKAIDLFANQRLVITNRKVKIL